MENYEVELDQEVLELLDTAIKQKHVCISIFICSSFSFFYANL